MAPAQQPKQRCSPHEWRLLATKAEVEQGLEQVIAVCSYIMLQHGEDRSSGGGGGGVGACEIMKQLAQSKVADAVRFDKGRQLEGFQLVADGAGSPR